VQTELDAEIVSWIGRVGAAGAADVQARFGMGRRWAYDRLSRLVADGLLAHETLLHRRPGLYLATRDGLRWRHLERLGVFRISPGSFEHASELARIAATLEPSLPGWQVLSDRELRAEENDTRQLIASVKVGELPGGAPVLHRPDLGLIAPTGRTVAVEVELSIKARARLARICRGYARARHIDHVYYLATPRVARAVHRGIADGQAQDRITVLALDDLQSIVNSEMEVRNA
jgi:hypothetical protein